VHPSTLCPRPFAAPNAGFAAATTLPAEKRFTRAAGGRTLAAMKPTILLSLLSLLLPAALSAADRPYTRNVAVVIYQGVEVLDFTGPAQVFASAAQFGSKGQEKAFNVYTVSKTKDPIVSHDFLNVVPNYGIADAPKPDIIVLPGGSSDNVIKDGEWMAWVKSSADGAENVLTVCTGAFIAGKIGLLDGLDTTTWYNAVPGLAKEFPKTNVIPGRRFIDSGKIITTAGVSAGIDGALHFVARTLGRYVADRTAEYMEYKWSPESYQTALSAAQPAPRCARPRAAAGRHLQPRGAAGGGGGRLPRAHRPQPERRRRLAGSRAHPAQPEKVRGGHRRTRTGREVAGTPRRRQLQPRLRVRAHGRAREGPERRRGRAGVRLPHPLVF
jgi:putative intracellular protease/amidase